MFIFLKWLCDMCFIPVVFIFSYALKFKLGWIFYTFFSLQIAEIYTHMNLESYLSGLIYIICIWLLSFYVSGVYSTFSGVMSSVDEWVKLVKGVSLATVIVMAITFIIPFIPGSRYVILYSWVFGITLLFIPRLILSKFEYQWLKSGRGVKNMLVIGANNEGQDVVERIALNPSSRLRYMGTLADKLPNKFHYHVESIFKYLGDTNSYKQVALDHNIQVIYVTRRLRPKAWLSDLIIFCEQQNIQLNIISDFASFMSGTITVSSFDGIPFICHDHLPTYPMGMFIKRILDILCSFFALVLAFPCMFLISLAIKIVSFSGPIIYKQERIGKDGRPFNMLKFRTMIPDAEKSGPVMVSENNENRYIRCGQFLRRYSLDELPQLINVLKGDMSIVGPRPERAYFVEQFTKKIPYFELRHRIKGGITGWAQINGRSVLTNRPEHKIKYDLYYLKNWSIVFDIKIILKTLSVVLKGEEAY